MRTANLSRKTKETEIEIRLSLDGRAATNPNSRADEKLNNRKDADSRQCPEVCGIHIETGCGFLDHMLTLFAFHSGFAISIIASGDTHVDYHHLTEDVGVALGQCLREAIGDARGITRYSSASIPMDEALVLMALDVSGRAYLNYDVFVNAAKVGDFDTELIREFLNGFCRSLGLTLHVKMFYGANAHHVFEAMFKGLGRTMKEAVSADPLGAGGIPSSKGILF